MQILPKKCIQGSAICAGGCKAVGHILTLLLFHLFSEIRSRIILLRSKIERDCEKTSLIEVKFTHLFVRFVDFECSSANYHNLKRARSPIRVIPSHVLTPYVKALNFSHWHKRTDLLKLQILNDFYSRYHLLIVLSSLYHNPKHAKLPVRKFLALKKKKKKLFSIYFFHLLCSRIHLCVETVKLRDFFLSLKKKHNENQITWSTLPTGHRWNLINRSWEAGRVLIGAHQSFHEPRPGY